MVSYTDNITPTSKQNEAGNLLADSNKKYYMFYGGSRSGKTFFMCYFIRHRARFYPGSKHLIARYSFANAKKTIWIQTLYPLLREDEKNDLCRINQVEGIVRYDNGSIILLGGLEPSRIDSVLAAEYATIFITEANENKYLDVEQLFSRLNDTAKHVESGNSIPLKFIIDLNPTVQHHWTNILFRTGIDPVSEEPKENYHEYCYLHFKPEDNIDNLADGYIESLKGLSPGLRKRFYEGEFGSYEGLVYSIDESVHIVDDFDIPKDWQKGRAVDFGYTHPFVCLFGAYDKSNDCLYVYQEHYKVKMTVSKHSKVIHTMTDGVKIEFTVCDHDAEDRATLEENGIPTVSANKQVLKGIDHVTELLHYDGEKRTNIKVFRSCKYTITEFYSYQWIEPATRIAKDREVKKENDDCMDALRYLAMKFFPDNRPAGYITGRAKLEEIKKENEKSPGFIINNTSGVAERVAKNAIEKSLRNINNKW